MGIFLYHDQRELSSSFHETLSDNREFDYPASLPEEDSTRESHIRKKIRN